MNYMHTECFGHLAVCVNIYKILNHFKEQCVGGIEAVQS